MSDSRIRSSMARTDAAAHASMSGDSMDDSPMFSRSGLSNPLGKLYPMPKVGLTECTLEGLRARAVSAGMPFSEYVRLVLEAHVHGPDHAARVAADRVRRVLGMEASSGAD